MEGEEKRNEKKRTYTKQSPLLESQILQVLSAEAVRTLLLSGLQLQE